MKTLFIAIIFSSSFAWSAQLMSSSVQASTLIAPYSQSLTPSCTNFTGVWAGLCKEYFNGQLTQTYGWTHTVVQNSCTAITWDGDDYVFGGVNQYTNTTKHDSYFKTMSFSLAGPHKDTLVLNTSNHNLELDTGDQMTYSGQGTAKIINGNLNTEINAHFYFYQGGVTSNAIGKTVCVLNLVP